MKVVCEMKYAEQLVLQHLKLMHASAHGHKQLTLSLARPSFSHGSGRTQGKD